MKQLLLISLALLIAVPVYAGDVLDYTAETNPAAADIMYLIKSPGGTGTDRQVTVGNLSKGWTFGNIVNLWTTCTSGYLKFDGTCDTSLGTVSGSGTQYYLPIWNSTSGLGALGSLGTSGYVLTSNGSGTAPTWQASGAGSMVYPGSGVAVSTGGAWGTSLDITGISNSTSMTSSSTAASATAVKAAYDLANGRQVNLGLLAGTLTNNYLCTYTASGTLISCNTNPASFQTALTYPVTGVASPTAGMLMKWGTSGNTAVDGLKFGTMTATKGCTYETATGLTCTSTPGTGDFKADGTVAMTGAMVPSTAGGQIIGNTYLPVGSIFIGNAAVNNVQLTAGTTSGAKVVTLPSQTGTVTVGPTTTAAGQVFMGTTTAGLGAWSTNVFPSTGTAYYLPVFSATNTMTQLAASGTTGQVLTGVTGAIPAWASPAVPTTVTVANEATDTTTFPLFATAATGDLGPKTNAALTFNSNTGLLSSTGLAGNSLAIGKTTSTAGSSVVYDDYSTELYGDGWMGSHQTGALGATRYYQFPTAANSAGQAMVFGTPAGGISIGTWVTPLTSASTLDATKLSGNAPIGAATGTSLMATGRVDGTVGVFKPAANAALTIVVATHGNAAYFFNSGDSDAHSIYTLPVPVGGEQYCVTNQATITTKPKFQAPANVYITSAGVITATAGSLIAGGALGDSACVVGVDSTHYMAYIQKGTWTPSAP